MRSIFATSKGVSPKSRYLPYAFTEQDIYMLMAVSGGELQIKPSNSRCHDRYIAIDYKTNNEKKYMSGSSSKDAGNKIMMILDVGDKEICYSLIDSLLA